MIRINLEKLLDKLSKHEDRRIALKEVAEESGCDRNAISRIINHPDVIPSAAVIDKLAQYFFKKFKPYQSGRSHAIGMDRFLMQRVMQDFITVYPDDQEYWTVLPQEIKDNPNKFPLDAIWSMYNQLTSSTREGAEYMQKEESIRSKLAAALKEKLTKTKISDKVTLTLSKEEAEQVVHALSKQASIPSL
jgi:hypothetical protein